MFNSGVGHSTCTQLSCKPLLYLTFLYLSPFLTSISMPSSATMLFHWGGFVASGSPSPAFTARAPWRTSPSGPSSASWAPWSSQVYGKRLCLACLPTRPSTSLSMTRSEVTAVFNYPSIVLWKKSILLVQSRTTILFLFILFCYSTPLTSNPLNLLDYLACSLWN